MELGVSGWNGQVVAFAKVMESLSENVFVGPLTTIMTVSTSCHVQVRTLKSVDATRLEVMPIKYNVYTW